MNDYIEEVRRRNRKLLRAEKLAITPESLLEQLRKAFEAGERAGEEKDKSLLERILG